MFSHLSLAGAFTALVAATSCVNVNAAVQSRSGRLLAQAPEEADAPDEERPRREPRPEPPAEGPQGAPPPQAPKPPPDPAGGGATPVPPPPPAGAPPPSPLPNDIVLGRAANEEELSREPCTLSSIEGYVCQKAHVNGTIRIHWNPYKQGDKNAKMAFEYIGQTTGWMAIGFTEYPGNMLGSKAIIVTDSAPGGMGLYRLGAKTVPGLTSITGTTPDFKISEMTVARDQFVHRTVGTFTREYDPTFNGTLILRMIGAAGKQNTLGYHGVVRRAFKFSLSQPGPAPQSAQDLPPSLTATPGTAAGAPKTSVNRGTPVANPAPPGQPPAPPPPPPPGVPPPVPPPPPGATPASVDPVTGASVDPALGPAGAPVEAAAGAFDIANTFATALLACIAFGAVLMT